LREIVKAYLFRIFERAGRLKTVVLFSVQFLCYIGFFLQPVLLQSMLTVSSNCMSAGKILLLALSIMMPAIADCCNNHLMQTLRRESKLELLERVFSKRYAYREAHTAASIQGNINEISFAVRKLEDTFVHTVLRTAAMALLYSAVLMQIDWPIGICYLLFIIVFIRFSICLTARNRGNIKEALGSTASVNDAIQDDYENFDSILTLKTSDKETSRLARLLSDESRAYLKTQSFTNWAAIIQTALIAGFSLIFLEAFIGPGTSAASMQTALLTLLYSVLNLTGFGPRYLVMHEMTDRINAGLALLDLEPSEAQLHPQEPGGKRAYMPDGLSLEFSHVSYRYSGRGELLHDLSVSFLKGKMSALIGPNGSGKSTLLKMGAGLLDPEMGTVTIPYGPDAKIMYLNQKAWLFNRTLLENICYPADRADVPYVMSLVDAIGLNSYVHSEEELLRLTPGDLRNRISGGEQQKMLVLRAILYQPQLLLCDEITSGMDPASSAEFYALMKQCLPHATIICTVHRLEELDHFDAVRGLLDDGK
jgi:ABC-type bacteriocin/lantibiotic exporter with double-glycine peptidase domain